MKCKDDIFRRIGYLALGLLSCWVGFIFHRDAWDNHHGVPVPRFAGIVLACFGVFLILYSIFAKKIPKAQDDHFVICTECGETFFAKEVPDQICPKCKGQMEELKGYYERHPEKNPSNNKKKD
jgi:hypothetical protein